MEDSKDLIEGMGYKSCWAVIEGSNQQKIAELLLKDTENCTYQTGLDKADNNKVLVTSDFEGTNYIIGLELYKFFYDHELLIDTFKTFRKVYLYMTHRVSESHGFAVLENGTITRLYRFDDDGIQNIGEPLAEEKKLGYHLPDNINEMWENDNVTDIDEEIIVTLALEQTGIDAEKYPYGNVIVGKLL